MIARILQFLRGLFGADPNEDLDSGSLADPKRDEHTGPSTEHSPTDAAGVELEDAADLPANYVEIPMPSEEASATRGLFEEGIGDIIHIPNEVLPPFDAVSVAQLRYHWCLDNGHGSLQAGKRYPQDPTSDPTQLLEWEFTREVNKRIIERLDALGIMYTNIVPEENVGSFLAERVARANELDSTFGLPKIYISIHGNAAGVESASGVETWYFLGSNSGVKLASIFQKHIIHALQEGAGDHVWKDRGIRTYTPANRNFYVLRNTNMPAVLTENGFYSNTPERLEMLKPEIQQKIADAHVSAILEIEQNGYDNAQIYPKHRKIQVR